MRKVVLLLPLIPVLFTLYGQNKPKAAPAPQKAAQPVKDLEKRHNDRQAVGYWGNVKKVSRVAWKNAPDSIINSKKDFDAYFLQAKNYIIAHYPDFENDKKVSSPRYTSVQLSVEEFDAGGDLLREENREGNEMFNVTYQYTVVSADKRQITGTSNKDGKKVWGGSMIWTEPNRRVQELTMGDMFVYKAQTFVFDSGARSSKNSLKLKDLFIMEADLSRLESKKEKEVWVHEEVAKDLRYDTLSTAMDTITHTILARDVHNNVTREIVSHSRLLHPAQVVWSKFEYY